MAKGSCSEQHYKLFYKRFKKCIKNEDLQTFQDAVHIFAIRQSAKTFNGKKLLDLHCPIAKIPARHNNATAVNGSAENACGLEPVLYLSKGARVVLRANVWVKAGLVNGSTGSIIDIVYDVGLKSPSDLPATVIVKFDHYSGPSITNGLVPIPPIEAGQQDLPTALESKFLVALPGAQQYTSLRDRHMTR